MHSSLSSSHAAEKQKCPASKQSGQLRQPLGRFCFPTAVSRWPCGLGGTGVVRAPPMIMKSCPLQPRVWGSSSSSSPAVQRLPSSLSGHELIGSSPWYPAAKAQRRAIVARVVQKSLGFCEGPACNKIRSAVFDQLVSDRGVHLINLGLYR